MPSSIFSKTAVCDWPRRPGLSHRHRHTLIWHVVKNPRQTAGEKEMLRNAHIHEQGLCKRVAKKSHF